MKPPPETVVEERETALPSPPPVQTPGESGAENDPRARINTASQWQLIRWKFVKHRIAVWALRLIAVLYLIALFCEFFAPYTPRHQDVAHASAPPQKVRLISAEGLHLRPFVYQRVMIRHPETLRRYYVEETSRIYPIRFLVRGEPYRLWGLFKTDLHLFGVGEGGTLYLLGTNHLGQDVLSRIFYGARISLTIGLGGVAMTFVLGLAIGAISGYYSGRIDNAIQRLTEVILSFPSIPLWMALVAAFPRHWSQAQIYFCILLVLSLIGWPTLARQVRGKILTLREEDFATAARLGGSSPRRIMWRHLLPSVMSHIIVSITLAVPMMILGETALSFLGLGLQPPVTSWGVMLQEAQNVQAVAQSPWLLTPVIFVIITVLAFNFAGDGLRDAADPYSR